VKTINAETAFALVYALYKEHPWLNEPGVMHPADAPAELEAVAFLLAGDLTKGWGDTSPAGQRVASSLLLDFAAKLRTPGHPITRSLWQVDETTPEWRQALSVLAVEIRKAHPQLRSRH